VDIVDFDKLLEDDLFLQGYIEKDEDGLLTYNDMDRLFRLIQKHAFLRLIKTLEDLADKRQQCLNKNKNDMLPSTEYTKLVTESKNAVDDQY
jgi:hypothetical protein